MGMELLTERQWNRVMALFASDGHVEVEVAWCVYHDVVDAYRHHDRKTRKRVLT